MSQDLTADDLRQSGERLAYPEFSRFLCSLDPTRTWLAMFARRIDRGVIAVIAFGLGTYNGKQLPETTLYFKETPHGYERIDCPREVVESFLAFHALRSG